MLKHYSIERYDNLSRRHKGLNNVTASEIMLYTLNFQQEIIRAPPYKIPSLKVIHMNP